MPPHGTLYFHIDYREAHYCKLLLDELFGRDAFLNELIWAYDYGAKPRRRWPAKHDTILVYVRTPGAHHFDADAVEREPYMAPGLVSAEKAARGKRPTDVWFHTIVPTNGREKTGYPTQKPEGVLRRMVAASSRPGGWCLDPFAGSGTLGAVCRELGRRFVLIDSNPVAIEVMRAAAAAGQRSSGSRTSGTNLTGSRRSRRRPVAVRRTRTRCWRRRPTGATSRPPTASCATSAGGSSGPVAAATLIASNGACSGSPREPSPTTKLTLSIPSARERALGASALSSAWRSIVHTSRASSDSSAAW